jgi:hypothetical protein
LCSILSGLVRIKDGHRTLKTEDLSIEQIQEALDVLLL